MAWPDDARHTDFAVPPAQEIVSSAFLNALQDAIIALYVKCAALFGTENFVEVTAYPEWNGAATQPEWVIDTSTPEAGWRCLTNAFALHFFIRARVGCVIDAVYAKVYNSTGGDATIPMQVFKPDAKFSLVAPTVAPALGSALFTNTNPQATHTWDIVGDNGLAITLAAGEYLLVAIGKNTASQAGDKVAGVQVIAQPIAVPV